MELVKQKEEFCRTYTKEGSIDRLTHVKYNVVHEGQLVGDANVSTGGFCVNVNSMNDADTVSLSASLERAFAAFDASTTTAQEEGGGEMKLGDIVFAFRLLSGAKLSKMDDADKFKNMLFI